MVKIEVARKISEKMDVTLREVEDFVDAFMYTVGQSLERGEKVVLASFGTFDVRQAAERQGRNPKTGESLIIPSDRYPAFRAGKKLKERVSVRNTSRTSDASKREKPAAGNGKTKQR